MPRPFSCSKPLDIENRTPRHPQFGYQAHLVTQRLNTTSQLSVRLLHKPQTYDEKPRRRLFEVLQSQGMQLNQQIEFLSDGGDDVRDVQLYLSPEADHLLDWFHVSMRITTLIQTAKGLPETSGGGHMALQADVIRDVERIKWFRWHGNVFKALQVLGSVESTLEVEELTSGNATAQKLYKAVESAKK